MRRLLVVLALLGGLVLPAASQASPCGEYSGTRLHICEDYWVKARLARTGLYRFPQSRPAQSYFNRWYEGVAQDALLRQVADWPRSGIRIGMPHIKIRSLRIDGAFATLHTVETWRVTSGSKVLYRESNRGHTVSMRKTSGAFLVRWKVVNISNLAGAARAATAATRPCSHVTGEVRRACLDAIKAVQAQAEFFLLGRDTDADLRSAALAHLKARFKGAARDYVVARTAGWPLDTYQPAGRFDGCICRIIRHGTTYVATAKEWWDIKPLPVKRSVFGSAPHYWRMVMRRTPHDTWVVHSIKVSRTPPP